MISVNNKIADEVRSHAILLSRYTESQKAEIYRRVNRLFNKLKVQTASARIFTGTIRQKRIEMDKLFKQAEAEIREAYYQIRDYTDKSLLEFAEYEAGWAKRLLSSNIGIEIGAITGISKEQFNAIVADTLIEGAPSSEWWSRQSVKLVDYFKDNVRKGWMLGEGMDEITRRLIGGTDKNGNPVFDIKKGTLRGAKALVRTSVQAISSEARKGVFKENADILKGVQWVSTLDTRTSVGCAALDGLMWDLENNPIGHDMVLEGPPRHWNCRSVLSPVAKSFEELGIEGLKGLEKVGGDVRASIDGEVADSKTFEAWLKEKPDSYADEIFGKERAEMWRNGKLSIRDMVDQKGRPLTLQELKDIQKAEQKKDALKTPKGSKKYGEKYDEMDKGVENLVNKVSTKKLSPEKMEYFQRKEAMLFREEIKWESKEALSKYTKREQRFQKELEKYLPTDKSVVVIRASEESADKILDSGRFKNQFSTKTSGGMLDTGERRNFEEEFFSIPASAKPTQRPVYGMIMDRGEESVENHRSSSQYGDVIFVLKEKIKEYTTISIGDSLNHGAEEFMPSPILEPSVRSLPMSDRFCTWDSGKSKDYYSIKPIPSVKRLLGRNIYDYIEAQIHTEVTIDNIEKVVFKNPPDVSTVMKLEKHKIPYEVKP